jgi:hypothetical protein
MLNRMSSQGRHMECLWRLSDRGSSGAGKARIRPIRIANKRAKESASAWQMRANGAARTVEMQTGDRCALAGRVEAHHGGETH